MLISEELIVKAARPYIGDEKVNYITGKSEAFYAAVVDVGHGEYCLVDLHEMVKGHGHKPTYEGEVIETYFSKGAALNAMARYVDTFDIRW